MAEPTVAEILQAARDLITPPERWTRESATNIEEILFKAAWWLEDIATQLIDAPIPTHAEVLAAFDRAIAAARDAA